MDRKELMEVTSITVGLMKRNPPIPFVSARGMARSSGWTEPELLPRKYVTPPADGIQDFDFVARPPSGISIPVCTKVPPTEFVFDNPPDWLRGVRIHAELNSMERMIGAFSKPLIVAEFVDDTTAIQTSAGQDDLEEFEVEFEEVDDGVTLHAEGENCHRFTLLQLPNIPEVKTEWKMRCVRILGRRVCTKLPVVLRRTCRSHIEVEACWPAGEDIRGLIEKCAKEAVAAGVIAGLLTGNLAAATSALTAYLRTCLAAASVSVASSVRIGLTRRKSCGPWKLI